MAQQTGGKGPFIKRLKVAFEGIVQAFLAERHMKIHGIAAIIVILTAVFLHVRLFDWVILILCIVLVIGLELVNTAIERVVDLVSPERHPLAKQAKDTAAGAVLVMAIGSVIIGFCIFLKYL